MDWIGKKCLNFLFCTADKFPPFRVDVAVLFGEVLSGRGHKIDWIMQSEGRCEKSYHVVWSGGNAWIGRTDLGETRLKRMRKHLFNILHSLRMFSLAYRNSYDFIQVKDQFISGILGLIAARLNDIPFYFWLSYPFPEAALYGARQGTARYQYFYWIKGVVFKVLLYRLILPYSDHVFVQSEQMKKDISEKGIPEEKMTIVPMGIDEKLFSERESAVQVDLNLGKDSIVYLGTLIRARRIDFLVRVLKIVRKTRPQARLILVGKGEDQEDIDILEREAERLGVREALVITGFMPQKQALEYVEAADVCVSPFYPTPILNSTSPTKVVEYMALGKPVVANDHPEQRVVIEESGGGICVPYDESAFANAVVSILGDREAALRMGELGKQYVFSYRSYKKIADIVENRYYEHIWKSSREVTNIPSA